MECSVPGPDALNIRFPWIGGASCGSIVVLLALQLHVLSQVLGSVEAYEDLTTRDVYVRITTIPLEPYVMLKPGYNIRQLNSTIGNGMFQGYLVDLLDHLMDVLGLEYRLQLVEDQTFGYVGQDGTWNGLVGELLRKEADVAAAPMYNTEQRAHAVDFTDPYMRVAATVLVRRPPTGAPPPLESARGLLKQHRLQYGTLVSGMPVRAFRNTNQTIYKRLWRRMKKFNPSAFTRTNEEGIERARRGGYAFILPYPIGDYIWRRPPCNLLRVDSFLMDAGFALAVPKGSGLLPQLNRVLGVLRVTGVLDSLYDKWWVQRGKCNGIHSSKIYSLDSSSATSSSFPSRRGVKSSSRTSLSISLPWVTVAMAFSVGVAGVVL